MVSEATRARTAALLPPEWDRAADHRIDLPNDVGPTAMGEALRLLVDDPGADSVMVLYAPPVSGGHADVAAAVLDAVQAGSAGPVVACFLGNRDAGLLRRKGLVIPEFPFPEEAALALARVAQYGEWRASPSGELPTLADADVDAARRSVVHLLDGHPAGRWLDPLQATDLLTTHGIVPIPGRLVGDADEAVAAAHAIGYPVAVKATGLARLAKTEAGGVALDVHGDDEIRQAYGRMRDHLGAAMQPALVQSMAEPGVECLIGLHRHPVLGDVMTLGAGGAMAERLEQVALRILPLTDADARRLISASRISTLLDDAGAGARDALEDLLLRLGALAEAAPEVAQVRLNPVLVGSAGAAVTDVQIRLEPWEPDPRPEVRRL